MKHLLTKEWILSDPGDVFPEERLPSVSGRPNCGICLSGGGMPAMTAGVGQLRAIRALGLLGRVRYISAVSGGARCAIPFTYYRAGARDDEDLLGSVRPPDRIDRRGLDHLSPGSLCRLGVEDPNPSVIRLALRGHPRTDCWLGAAGELFLARYGLYDPDLPAYFSLDAEAVAGIRALNPSLSVATFHTIHDAERPYLVAHGAFVGPTDLSPFRVESLVDLEYTPLYVGTPFGRDAPYESWDGRGASVRIGGGFFEPFAFGSPFRVGRRSDGLCEVAPPDRPFTLADILGTATASYSPAYHNLYGDWSPRRPYLLPGGGAPPRVFNFGDAGPSENYGLISLLLRRVRRIVVFINTGTPLRSDYDPLEPPTPDDLDATLPSFFGYKIAGQIHNQVFSQADFAPVVRALLAAKASGRPVMAATRLRVRPNDWWGVPEGEAEICWVYNDRVPEWEGQLRPGLRNAIRAGNRRYPTGPFQRFPHYLMTGQNGGCSIALTPAQMNLLADLCCWNVLQCRKVFESFLV